MPSTTTTPSVNSETLETDGNAFSVLLQNWQKKAAEQSNRELQLRTNKPLVAGKYFMNGISRKCSSPHNNGVGTTANHRRCYVRVFLCARI